MYKSVNDKDSHLWDVIDLDTGKRIKGVQWADERKHQIERLLFDKDSGLVDSFFGNITRDIMGKPQTVIEHRNIKLVKK